MASWLQKQSACGPRTWWLRLGAALGLMAFLIPMACVRMIDGDEGYYLMAARLVSEGKHLYADFFCPQMPLLEEVYGAWFWIFGRSWYGARVLSGLLAVGTGLLLMELVLRVRGSRLWAIVTGIAYLATGLSGGWFTTAKSYSLTAFLLVLGVFLLEAGATPIVAACGGLALVLAAECRLYVLIVLPFALLFLVRRHGLSRASLRYVAAFSAGALLGALLLLPHMLRDWHNFYFDNWTFHSMREYGQAGFITKWPNKEATLKAVFGYEPHPLPGSLQFLGLTLVAICGLFRPRSRRNRLASYLWPALLLVSIVPSPTDVQYFCLLVPFLILEFVEAIAGLELRWPRATGLGLAAFGIAFVFLGARDLERYLVTAQGVPGVLTQDRVPRWSISTVRTVAGKIDAARRPEGASWWPGYFVSTTTPIRLSLANDFGFRAAPRLTPAERRRVGIVTHEEVGDMIKRHSPPLFVEGNWATRPQSEYLPKQGYRQIDAFHNVRIWTVP